MKKIYIRTFCTVTFCANFSYNSKAFSRVNDDNLVDIIVALEITRALSKKIADPDLRKRMLIYNSVKIYTKFNTTKENFINSLCLLKDDVIRLRKIYNQVSETLQSYI